MRHKAKTVSQLLENRTVLQEERANVARSVSAISSSEIKESHRIHGSESVGEKLVQQ